MLHAKRWGLLVGVLGFTLTWSLMAGEVDELRAKAKRLRNEAAAQAGNGNPQAAEELERESNKLLEKAERLEHESPEPHLNDGRLKERLQDLVQEEQKLIESNAPPEARDRVSKQIHEVKTLLAHRARPDSDPKHHLELAARRVQHLRVAAENLKLAEAHDLAQEVMKKAEAQEREIGEAKRRLAEQGERERKKHDAPEVQELRSEVERLRAELQELRQAVKERP